MAVDSQPVVGQPACHRRQEGRRGVRRDPGVRGHREPRAVRHQVQPPEPPLRPPADPPVARTAPERAAPPGGQRHPAPPPGRDVPQAPGSRAPETEVVVAVHQRVPRRALLRRRRTDPNVPRAEPRGRLPENGTGVDAANRHAPTVAHAGWERRRKITDAGPAPRARARGPQGNERCQAEPMEFQRGMALIVLLRTLLGSGTRQYKRHNRAYCKLL